MSDMFYGWYFRCQSDASTMAVIPAVHISGNIRSCSIQVITEKGAWNKTFPIQQFRINRKKGIMQIGENLFSKKGIRLKIETKDLRVQGLLRFGPFAEPKYDIMGPFRFIPGMECRHSVYSMEHSVGGSLMLNGENLHFDGGKGYMEGDSRDPSMERQRNPFCHLSGSLCCKNGGERTGSPSREIPVKRSAFGAEGKPAPCPKTWRDDEDGAGRPIL